MADQFQKQQQPGHREQAGSESSDGPDQAEDGGIARQPDDVDKASREDQAGRQDHASSDRARDNDFGMGAEQNPGEGGED